MSAPLQDVRREVLPRWRSLSSTIALGEHGPRGFGTRSAPPSEFFDMLRDWEAERSLPFASEVVGSAIVFGVFEQAREAAEFVLANSQSASALSVELANKVLGVRKSPGPTRLEPGIIRKAIQSLKTEVRIDPRHAFAWAELARSYTMIGQFTKAIEAMDRALDLAKNNRYVLRAAARLHVHTGDPERAHVLLARAKSTEDDPWLIAAEIATARMANKDSHYVKAARKIVESNAFSYFDKTELASSLATLEADSGSLRQARKLFRTSLIQPNENAVAQARWASTRGLIDLDHDQEQKRLIDLIQLPRAYEARAWHAFYLGDWETSVRASKRWSRDQPFAASPAVQASYVTSVAQQNHEQAAAILHEALTANPTDPSLLNNLAYSLANLDRLDEAENNLARAKNSATHLMKPTILATSGLIAFRRQQFDEGATLYEKAIQEALMGSNEILAAKASLFYAVESLRAGRADSVAIAERAIALSSAWKNSDFEMLRGHVFKALEKYLSSTRRAPASASTQVDTR